MSHLHLIVKNEYGALYADNSNNYVDGMVMHLEVFKWNKSAYKNFLIEIKKVQAQLALHGIKRIFGTPPSPKEEKLLTMLGLKHTGLTIGGLKLMELS